MMQSIQQLRASSNESLRRKVASICCLGGSNAAVTIALPIKALALSHKQLLQTTRLLVISIVATRPRWRVCSLTFEFKPNDVQKCCIAFIKSMAMWVACDADRSQPSVQLQNVQSSHASKLREAQRGAAVHPPMRIHSRQENISVHIAKGNLTHLDKCIQMSISQAFQRQKFLAFRSCCLFDSSLREI